MAYIAANSASYVGKVVGNGQCVAYVKEASGAPATSAWSAGDVVKTASPATGTAIATFDDDGTYGNHTDGRSHAAILKDKQAAGLNVYDQWTGHPVSQRLIRYKNGAGTPNNDGDAFKIIE
jgi:hypothetical protein